MKILMVNTGVFPVPSQGGAENHVYYISRSLSEQGIKVDLVSDIGDDAKFGNINIYPVNLPELSLFDKGFKGYMLRHASGGVYAFKKARELLKSDHYDIIHVHGRVAPFLLSFFKRDTPLVFTLHDNPPSREQSSYYIYKISYKLFQETAVKRANHVITVHTRLRKELVSRKVSSGKISVIPNGVDTNLFSSQKENLRENAVLFVGWLTKRKGVNYLLEAISDTNVKLIIIGDGPERFHLMQLANCLGIKAQVTFTGIVDVNKLIEYYSSASIFVLASLREAFPLSLLEAMSCNLPVISTNTSGMPEIIKGGYNGFLVEPRNVKQLRERIQYLIENHELCKEMGENARKTVEEKYSWDVIARETIKIYEKVLEEKQ